MTKSRRGNKRKRQKIRRSKKCVTSSPFSLEIAISCVKLKTRSAMIVENNNKPIGPLPAHLKW